MRKAGAVDALTRLFCAFWCMPIKSRRSRALGAKSGTSYCGATMSEFDETMLRITMAELQALSIPEPERIAETLLNRLQSEFGGGTVYVPSNCQHRRRQIKIALDNGTPIAAAARAYGVSVKTVRRIAAAEVRGIPISPTDE